MKKMGINILKNLKKDANYASAYAGFSKTLEIGSLKYIFKTSFRDHQVEMLEAIKPARAAELLKGMDISEVAKILSYVKPGKKDDIIRQMDRQMFREYNEYLGGK